MQIKFHILKRSVAREVETYSPKLMFYLMVLRKSKKEPATWKDLTDTKVCDVKRSAIIQWQTENCES